MDHFPGNQTEKEKQADSWRRARGQQGGFNVMVGESRASLSADEKESAKKRVDTAERLRRLTQQGERVERGTRPVQERPQKNGQQLTTARMGFLPTHVQLDWSSADLGWVQLASGPGCSKYLSFFWDQQSVSLSLQWRKPAEKAQPHKRTSSLC